MKAPSILATALLACTLTACASSEQSAPVRVESRDVPFGLIDAPQPDSDVPDAPGALSLYYLDGGRLVEITRPSVTEPTARRALRGLLAGPTESEHAFGATSALPSRASARLVHVRENVARVELADRFLEGGVVDQPAALAQIVYTLTAVPGIEQIVFTGGGEEVAVPTPDGTLVEGPVARDTFAAIVGGAAPDASP